ncbi:MAG: FkbM family methyltransferase [Candidatus Omnitrophota bacterium]|jgi:FkbM family methyltransferase
MNILRSRLYIRDFIPPIFKKVKNKLRYYFGDDKRIPPFTNCPQNIDVRWVIDIGANEGWVAKAALDSYPKSSVICFEPVKRTFEKLQGNLSAYGSRVYYYNMALSDRNGKNGFETINITSFNGANSLEHQSDFHKKLNPAVYEIKTETVQTARLDEIAQLLPAKKVEIVKIDVEGHELNVLKGGANFLSNCAETIIIEISLMRDSSLEHQALFDIFSLLNALGFRLVNIFDLYHAKDTSLMLTQMDCVFRNIAFLTKYVRD